MARTNTLGNFLTDVADAIREKGGTTEPIQASSFDTAIINLPSGSGDTKSFDDLNTNGSNVFSSFIDYLADIVDTYETYTNDPITLYTPDIECKNYIIHKRSNGNYRILWSNIPYAGINSSTSISFCAPYIKRAGEVLNTFMPFDEMQSSIFDLTMVYTIVSGPKTSYYSNEFSTINEIITEIQKPNGQITYTKWTSGSSFSGVIDTPYKIPYTNTNVFDNTDNNKILMSRKISKNETITTA